MPWVRDDWPNSVSPCDLCGEGVAMEYDFVQDGRAVFTAFLCGECATRDLVPKTYLDDAVTRFPWWAWHVRKFVESRR